MKALGFAIGVTLLSACAAPAAIGPPASVTHVCPRHPVHITIIGDSLAKGWGAQHPQNTLAGGIYDFVRKRRPGTTMRNVGVPGATTEEVAGANDGAEMVYSGSHSKRLC